MDGCNTCLSVRSRLLWARRIGKELAASKLDPKLTEMQVTLDYRQPAEIDKLCQKKVDNN